MVGRNCPSRVTVSPGVSNILTGLSGDKAVHFKILAFPRAPALILHITTAMNPERFTHKTAEAFNAAQSLATRMGHAELKPAHLVSALLDQEGGIAPPLLEKAIGRDQSSNLQSQISSHLRRQPSVSGSGGLG